MTNTSSKKVCIVVISLAVGGAERASALLSHMLYNLGYEVHIVSIIDKIEFNYSGELYNLGKFKSKNSSLGNRLLRLKKWRSYMKAHNFDYVIDSRTRIGFLKEWVISKYIYTNKNTIYTVHSYNINSYINKNKIFGRFLYGSALAVVAVSKAIQRRLEAVYNFKNVETIYNPISLTVSNIKKQNVHGAERFILFFGRIDDEVKNITLLLNAYKISDLRANKIKLKILGDGKDVAKLKQLAKDIDLTSHVEFLPAVERPELIVREALFTVLTSRYEGFPMVLIESLAMGVPVVSVDCKSGPSEVIQHEENGLLVENHNPSALSEAFNTFVNNTTLYNYCKDNAKSSVAHLSTESIAESWKKILS